MDVHEKIDDSVKNLYLLTPEKKKSIETELADPAVYDDNDKVRDLQFDYGQLLKEIDQAEATWLEAETVLEQATKEAGL